MLKALTFIIFVISLCSSAMADRYSMNHERFIHLSTQEKNEFIIKTMEFMVELEDKYEKALVTQGPHSEEARRYSYLLHGLKSFLLSDAHAATDHSEFSEDFAELIGRDDPKAKGSKCFYAGWISRTTKVSYKNHRGETQQKDVCVHPGRLPKGTLERTTYMKTNSCPKPDPMKSSVNDKISCNPVVFGLKSKASSTEFCVDAGVNHSVNSSLSCMKLALETDATNQDTRDERLSYLRSQLETEPKLAKSYFSFLSKACLCEDNDLGTLSKMYLSRVRPHRTCFGLLNMMSETVDCREGEIEGLELDFIKKIKSHTISMQTTSSIDNFYNTFIGQLKNDNPTEYGRVCGIALPAKKVEKEIEIETEKEKEKPVEVPTKYSCSATCSPIEGGKDNQVKCEFSVTSDKNPSEAVSIEVPEEETFVGQELTVKIKDSKATAKCLPSLPVVTKEEGPAPVCAIAVTGSEDGAQVAAASVEGAEVKSILWSNGGTELSIPFTKDLSPLGAKITVMKNNKELTLECPAVDFPEDEEKPEEKPELKVEVKETTKTLRTFKAIITGEREGWTIIWFKKGGSKRPAPEEPRIRVTEDESTEDIVEEKPKKPEGPKDELEKTKDKEEISVEKGKKETEICAQLVKGSESTGQSCGTVPALDAPKAPAQSNGPIMQNRLPPQGPPRGNSGTSAFGIR